MDLALDCLPMHRYGAEADCGCTFKADPLAGRLEWTACPTHDGAGAYAQATRMLVNNARNNLRGGYYVRAEYVEAARDLVETVRHAK